MLRKAREILAVPGDALRYWPRRRIGLAAVCGGLFVGMVALMRHEPVRSPPPALLFDGLPVSGGLADARRAGFDDCFASDAVHL